MHEHFFKRSALVALLLAITINALANIIPLNGMTTGAISDLYPLIITPAGYVFAIWSIIYFGLLAFCAYSLNQKQHLPIGVYILFFASSLANGAWIVAWHEHMLIMSVIFMLLILLSLIRINEFLLRHTTRDAREYLYIHAPFQIYLAWIIMATILNVGATLYAYNWNSLGLNQDLSTLIVLGGATFVTTATAIRYKSIPFVCVILWALIGIAVKPNLSTIPLMTTVALVGWHVLLIAYLYTTYSKKELLREATRT